MLLKCGALWGQVDKANIEVMSSMVLHKLVLAFQPEN